MRIADNNKKAGLKPRFFMRSRVPSCAQISANLRARLFLYRDGHFHRPRPGGNFRQPPSFREEIARLAGHRLPSFHLPAQQKPWPSIRQSGVFYVQNRPLVTLKTVGMAAGKLFQRYFFIHEN